jgi:NADH-quinone oxidoreductase subunit C/D
MNDASAIAGELRAGLPGAAIEIETTRDAIPTVWLPKQRLLEALRHLKYGVPRPFRMLYDLTAIDERGRSRSPAASDARAPFTLIHQLRSFDRNQDLRIKVALDGDAPHAPTATALWPAANWYEREAWDMFGIRFDGHPDLRRILMPEDWRGHPLRKEHYARATEAGPIAIDDRREEELQARLRFRPQELGLSSEPDQPGDEVERMFLNLGPQHPGTHGVLRIVLQLAGETIENAVPEIGFHHRGVEKMGERQSWHTYLPYTDRVDYLAGVLNNLAYVLSVERLAGIEVPPRAQVIRVMLSELFRIASHLVWYGTFAQDLGALSPVFYMFNDRERLFDIIEGISGFRMHPSWFRIGGVAADLPRGWDERVAAFLEYLPPRLAEYDGMVMRNRTFQARTRGVGVCPRDTAIEWGVTGPNLRATGLGFDLRKARPYSGYENFEFEVPTAEGGDCWARAVVRVEEMRQSLRIVEQCLSEMPSGPIKSEHPLTTPPDKQRALHDIETLIAHFLNVSWGPRIPAGEAAIPVEGAKGNNSYYLVSDGDPVSYRTRIRTPSFPHVQLLPLICRGLTIPDLIAILGSIDYVLADVDR